MNFREKGGVRNSTNSCTIWQSRAPQARGEACVTVFERRSHLGPPGPSDDDVVRCIGCSGLPCITALCIPGPICKRWVPQTQTFHSSTQQHEEVHTFEVALKREGLNFFLNYDPWELGKLGNLVNLVLLCKAKTKHRSKTHLSPLKEVFLLRFVV